MKRRPLQDPAITARNLHGKDPNFIHGYRDALLGDLGASLTDLSDGQRLRYWDQVVAIMDNMDDTKDVTDKEDRL